MIYGQPITFGGSSKLPKGYTQLEYIESTGTQYIDTGYIFTSQNIKIGLDFEFTGSFSNSSLFGSQNTTTGQFNIATHADPQWFFVGTSHTLLPISFSQNVRYSLGVRASNGVFTVDVDGSISTANYTGSVDNTQRFPLLAFCYGGDPRQYTSAAIYSCQIYDNGTLVRDFVPCANDVGTVGLYDLVNDVFYGNAGSGEFKHPFYSDPNPVLLWTNASPTSKFAAQTVGVNGAGYDAYLVEASVKYANGPTTIVYIRKNYSYNQHYYTMDSSGYTGHRQVTSATNTAITFSAGNGYTEYGIPLHIWGVKFTLV